MATTHARQPRESVFQPVRIPRVNTYEISTDPSRLQLDAIHAYLTRSYWSPGIPRDVVARAIANSLCFGLYVLDGQAGHGDTQVGFALHGVPAPVPADRSGRPASFARLGRRDAGC